MGISPPGPGAEPFPRKGHTVSDHQPALTTEDIRALKTADRIVFQYWKGRSILRAIRDRSDYADGERQAPVYTAAEQRLFPDTSHPGDGRCRDITTDVSMYGYTPDGFQSWNLHSNPEALASYVILSPGSGWLTVVNFLRAGDRVTLEWIADNNNDYLRDAGLHQDELRLSVARGDTSDPKKHKPVAGKFLIDKRVCPDNSARMIHRYGR